MSDFRILTGTVAVSPQITTADIDEAAEAGVTLIINNRPDGEEADQPTNDELKAYAKTKGIKWQHIPVAGGALSFEPVGQMAECIFSAEGPILAFCRSGTRSCTLWALAQNLSDDYSVEEIIGAASDVGYDLSHMADTLEDLRKQKPSADND
ncbi:TIGR01244 family sulfur transferase [Kordiimonas sp.]|uniref:TIGR01244 family sulfur transferase n=1 Tax=Kordiimonas sp. TaxID=1970157 RepID=UPI003A8E3D2F